MTWTASSITVTKFGGIFDFWNTLIGATFVCMQVLTAETNSED
jgi:hypothetical protein